MRLERAEKEMHRRLSIVSAGKFLLVILFSELSQRLESQKEDSFAEQMMLKIICNLQIQVKRLHIRFSMDEKYCFGLKLDTLFIWSTNDKWEKVFINAQDRKIPTDFKVCRRIFSFGLF
jgi:hypothetical protein